MATNQTENYQLNQWEPTDKVLRTDFNADNLKIDMALAGQAADIAAEAAAREAAAAALAARDCCVKLLDQTLEQDTQRWDIDMSSIDLSQYQKLVIYPHLSSNSDQWVHLRIDEKTAGYFSRSDGSTAYCTEIPAMNDPNRQNFGICEYTMLIQLPQLYVLKMGIGSNSSTTIPGLSGHKCPALDAGVTRLNTLNFWFDFGSYLILAGSTIQIYGVTR